MSAVAISVDSCVLARTLSVARERRITVVHERDGKIPKGFTVDSNCGSSLCVAPNHVICRQWKMYDKRSKWKEYAERIAALNVGESFDLPEYPNGREDLARFRNNVSVQKPVFSIRFYVRTMPTGLTGIRVMRVGSFSTWLGTESIAPDHRPPLLISSAIGVYLTCVECGEQFLAQRHDDGVRRYCSHTCSGRGRCLNIQVVGLRPGSFYLGFMSKAGMPEEVAWPVSKCSERACIFPATSKGICRQHENFFDPRARLGRQLDIADLFASDQNTAHPTFYVGYLWQEKRGHEMVRFQYKGALSKGEKISEDWWKANVIEPEKQVATGLQHGVGGLHHGKRKKKRPGKRSQTALRKSLLANRNGHAHPSKKPREKFEREAITDVAMWAPPAEEADEYSDPIFAPELETAVDDDEYGREQAMAQMSQLQGEFEEAFGGSE